MITSRTLSLSGIVLGIGLALTLAAPSGAADPKLPRTRDGGRTGLVTGDLITRPHDVGAPTSAPDRPLERTGLDKKGDPVKPKPAKGGEKGVGSGGKKMPSPVGTAPTGVVTGRTSGGIPKRGGSIDPAGIRARLASEGDIDEEETAPLRPRPDTRPVTR